MKNGKLYSQRAARIEKLLLKRKDMFGLDCEIKMSKSCLEGKEIWEVYNKLKSIE